MKLKLLSLVVGSLFALPANANLLEFTIFDSQTHIWVDGINDKGQIVGSYWNTHQGFIYENSIFSNFNLPLSNAYNPSITPYSIIPYVSGINNNGQVVGNYSYVWGANGKSFVIDLNSNDISRVDLPNQNLSYSWYPVADAINDKGQIAGTFFEQGYVNRGFVKDSNGDVTVIDFPGAKWTNDRIADINNNGQLVGNYLTSNGQSHGFLFSDGVFKNIEISLPNWNSGVYVTGINDSGQIVGYGNETVFEFDLFGNRQTSFKTNGFVMNPNGELTIFDAPNGQNNILVTDINNKGQIVGSFYDFTMGKRRGFITSVLPIPEVPEPESLALFLFGLPMVAWVKRRKSA
jgi:probable HAF family extracellular repeat protein